MASNLQKKYQTISDFLAMPFHKPSDLQKDLTYETKYRSMVAGDKIKYNGFCVVEDSYYIHIKVPSESQKDGNYMYDVVIRFFTDNPEVSIQSHLRNYFIQFFSNSPSFMYQYAYLYNKEGFLIEALYNKLDPDYIDTPPEKTNKNMIMGYDKSIYFACKFLTDKKFRYLEKNGFGAFKKKQSNIFFREISDFRSIKLDQQIMNEERKLSRVLDGKSPKQRKGLNNQNKKQSSSSTMKEKREMRVNRITPKKGVGKKTATKTTRKS